MKILMMLLSILLLLACQAKNTPTDVSSAQDSRWFTQADKTTNIDGLEIRYRDQGNSEGIPLLMLHGFSSSLETWDSLSEILSNEFRIIRFDLPGHGLTGPDEQQRYSNEQTVEFISAFIKELNLDRPVVIGNSLGGLLAWKYAALSSSAPRALVLLSPGGVPFNGVSELPGKMPVMVEYYLKNAPQAGITQATQNQFGDPTKLSATRLEQIGDMMRRPGNGEALVTRAKTFTLPDPAPVLKNLTTNTLLIWGGRDAVLPVSQAQTFVDNLPNVQFITYDEIGHLPQEESPERTADNIRNFLSTIKVKQN